MFLYILYSIKKPLPRVRGSDLYLIVISFKDILTFLRVLFAESTNITMNILFNLMMIMIVHITNDTKHTHYQYIEVGDGRGENSFHEKRDP